MRALRFNPNLFLLLGIALLGALFLQPTSLNWLRAPTTILFYPISAPSRAIARSINAHVSTPSKSVSAERSASKTVEQLQNENETLKSQIAYYQSQNDELQRRLDERKDWRADLMKLCEVASVSGADPSGRPILVLSPGSARNAVESAPVLDGQHVVGRLDVVGIGQSKVILITDVDVSETAEMEHYRADGSGFEPVKLPVSPRGDGKGHLIVYGVKKTDIAYGEKGQRVNIGDRVVLHDTEWPRELQGLGLGEIESFTAGTTPLFCNIVIRPFNDLMKLRQVMVWKK